VGVCFARTHTSPALVHEWIHRERETHTQTHTQHTITHLYYHTCLHLGRPGVGVGVVGEGHEHGQLPALDLDEDAAPHVLEQVAQGIELCWGRISGCGGGE
jgi:hypothetical protein